jgi:integrase
MAGREEGKTMTDEVCTEIVYRPDFPKPFYLYDAWSDYIAEHCARKGQEVRRVVYVARHWLRIMGPDSEPATWKRATVDRYAEQRRAEGVMGSTIRREMSLQRAALSHAKKWERIDKVPHFEKPSGQGSIRRPMTEEEYARLMRSPLPRRVRMFYLLAYHTGHRARAIETLPWDRVDLERGTIDFNEPGARRTNKRRVDGFPMPDELRRRLVSAREYRDTFRPDDPYVIGLGPRGKCSTTYHDCKAALKAVGIDELGICRHTVRKTFVTERIKAGANPEKVAALIADNPVTMRKHYSVLLTEDLRATADFRSAA